MTDSPCIRLGAEGGAAGLVIDSCPITEPGPGEIRVRLQASSLNYADYAMVSGSLFQDAAGRIPLADGAGIVDAVGPDVAGWAVGDPAMARFYPGWDSGPYNARYTAWRPGMTIDGHARRYETNPATWFMKPPRGYSAAEAATLGCAALTAWRALFVETRIGPGDWVMTQGTGGVALFALQFAKACGARVIATTSSADKAGALTRMGADHVVNVREDPKWGRTVFALAGGRGCDAIVEIGGGAGLAQSFAAVREAGFIGLIGVLDGGGRGGGFSTVPLMLKNARLQGLTVGNLHHLTAMIDAIDATGIRPVIADRFPLERLAAAFDRMTRKDYVGKIVIDI